MSPIELKFTNNFYIFVASVILSNDRNNGVSATQGTNGTLKCLKSLRKLDGTYSTANAGILISRRDNNLSYYENFNLGGFGSTYDGEAEAQSVNFIVGSGTNPTDYSLEKQIITEYSVSLSAVHENEDDLYGALTYTVSVNNTSSTDTLNINEIGITKGIKLTDSNRVEKLLMASGVLNETLEIAPGTSKTLTVQLKMPLTAS